jgi:imidazoleglycerol phosphate dehydratase HisB
MRSWSSSYLRLLMNQKCISRVETKSTKNNHHKLEIKHKSIISAAETAAKEIPKITTPIAKQVTT